MALTVNRPVNVKVLVTEAFRSQLQSEIEYALGELDLQEQQLEFQGRRAVSEFSKSSPKQAHNARTQWEQEKERLAGARRELIERKNQAQQLELGVLFLYATIEGYTELTVGDSLFDKLRPAEVLVKDNVVIEIR